MPTVTMATAYGLRSRLWGRVTLTELTSWAGEVSQLIDQRCGFSQLIDARDCGTTPGDPADATVVFEMMSHAVRRGVVRSAVLVPSDGYAQRWRRLAWRSGVYEVERYFHPYRDTDADATALAWVEHGLDPFDIWQWPQRTPADVSRP